MNYIFKEFKRGRVIVERINFFFLSILIMIEKRKSIMGDCLLLQRKSTICRQMSSLLLSSSLSFLTSASSSLSSLSLLLSLLFSPTSISSDCISSKQKNGTKQGSKINHFFQQQTFKAKKKKATKKFLFFFLLLCSI